MTYGGVPDAAALIESLGVARSTWRVVVACNKPGDADEATSRLDDLLDDGLVTIADYPDNPGYLPAAARAVEQFGLRGGPVVISNADLVAGPKCLAEITVAAEHYPTAMWIAPSIIGALRRDQNPMLRRRPSAKRLRLLAALHRFPRAADLAVLRRNGHGATLPKPGRAGESVWAGHGSCIVLTALFFSAGGALTYPFKLFGEELWLGAEVERLGGEVRYVPEIRLRHGEHATTGSHRRRGEIARVKYEGLRYWARRARAEGW
ncbi:hypothetical protein [Nocardioides bigeumensis]|uniref:Glycosyltransferase family 2 protein n=1 Tax=Nocardioides bigeumensis TaxID=433657 RepID=A0ABN2XUD5_9ACTN